MTQSLPQFKCNLVSSLESALVSSEQRVLSTLGHQALPELFCLCEKAWGQQPAVRREKALERGRKIMQYLLGAGAAK